MPASPAVPLTSIIIRVWLKGIAQSLGQVTTRVTTATKKTDHIRTCPVIPIHCSLTLAENIYYLLLLLRMCQRHSEFSLPAPPAVVPSSQFSDWSVRFP